MKRQWLVRTVRLLAYGVIGLGVATALAWFPDVVPWSLRPDLRGVAWIEESGGLYWVVSHTPRSVSAIAYETQAKAQRSLNSALADGRLKAAPAGGPPVVPGWAHFRNAAITKDIMTPGVAGLGGAVSGDSETGWPLAAFRGGLSEHMGPGNTMVRVRSEHILRLPDGRDVPIRPLWPGLLGDMLIFAAGARALHYATAVALHRLKARLRPGPGSCARCRYSREGLRTDAACPECGLVPAP